VVVIEGETPLLMLVMPQSGVRNWS